jgi:predicted MFS family arabinose efflux permease
MIIWLAPSAWIAGLGALLTGSGFSLVFPALGVKRSDRLKNKTRDGAGTYSAFLDLALGLTGPLAGWVAGYYALDTIYLLAAVVVVLAFLLVFVSICSNAPLRATYERRSPAAAGYRPLKN